jgi:hypothetical protein
VNGEAWMGDRDEDGNTGYTPSIYSSLTDEELSKLPECRYNGSDFK